MKPIKFRYSIKRENGYCFQRFFTLQEIEAGMVKTFFEANLIGVGDIVNRDQSTGLEDKNGKGKEVYEGDISTLNSKGMYVCKWSNKYTAFMWEEKDGDVEKEPKDLENMVYFCGDGIVNFEVIGNVHESPKLLEKQE